MVVPSALARVVIASAGALKFYKLAVGLFLSSRVEIEKLTGNVTVPESQPCTKIPVFQPKSIQLWMPFKFATAPDPMIAILFGFRSGSRFPVFFRTTMPSRATARAVAVWFVVCTFRPLPPPLVVTAIDG